MARHEVPANRRHNRSMHVDVSAQQLRSEVGAAAGSKAEPVEGFRLDGHAEGSVRSGAD